MKSQLDFSEELSYSTNLVHALKTRQNIDSSRAVLYMDTRPDGNRKFLNYNLAGNESKLTRITYIHPDAPTPYAVLQFTFDGIEDGSGINYTVYRDTIGLTDEYETHWLLQLRNLSSTADSFTVYFGVKSSAPGTVSAAIL